MLGPKQRQILTWLTGTTWAHEQTIREGTGSTRPLHRELQHLLDKGLVRKVKPNIRVLFQITTEGVDTLNDTPRVNSPTTQRP